MDTAKRNIILILLFIILLAVFAGFFFKKGFFMEPKMELQCEPVFSKDGRFLAFWKFFISQDRDGAVLALQSAQLNLVDFQDKARKTFFTLPLKKYEDLRISSVSGADILYGKISYDSGLMQKYLFTFKDGISTFLDIHDNKFINPSNEKQAVFLSSGKDSNTIQYMAENKPVVNLMSSSSSMDYFYNVTWVGKRVFFQLHVSKGAYYSDELWLYDTDVSRLINVSENSNSVIFSPSGSVAILNAAQISGENAWELSVKNISQDLNITLVSSETYKGDVLLYDWSPSSSGFLFQNNDELCFYDTPSQNVKPLLNASKDGFWGYPLSPYYVNFSPDSKNVVVLCYKKMDDGKYREIVYLIDIASDSKRIITEQFIDSFGKRMPLRQEFYKRIVWSPSEDLIVFESKIRNNPTLKRLVYMRSDGSHRRHI